MIQAQATARYIRTSAQKAGLVLDLIRGKDVNRALATLRFARKSVAEDVAKLLRSAIANAQQKDGFSGDVDRLFVSACFANQGPSQKRVRPAPMGRAFRVAEADRAPHRAGVGAAGKDRRGRHDRRRRRAETSSAGWRGEEERAGERSPLSGPEVSGFSRTRGTVSSPA